MPLAWISQRIGGDQIDYADEKPEIRCMFADALARHGVTPKMDDAYDGGTCGPAAEGRMM